MEPSTRPALATPSAHAAAQYHGLSESEAAARRARGEGNAAPLSTSRSATRILLQNTFNPINSVLYAIAAVLVVLGVPADALLTAGLVFVNVAVGAVQELRAKRQLDRIALLARPLAAAMRGGREVAIAPEAIVRGDLLILRPGDQVLVDGSMVSDAAIQMDESLLTGESEPAEKQKGDAVYSGSFCISGSGVYEAEHVGAASLAQRLTAKARTFRNLKTPLQGEISLAIWVMALVMLALGVEVVSSSRHHSPAMPLVESVRAAAVLASLVPQGLALMVTLTYAMAALRLAGKGIVIQRMNAVESSSHLQILCLDKTGTLTTNRLTFHALEPLGTTNTEAARWLGDFAASTKAGNQTTAAIAAAFGGQPHRVHDEQPFSSARKWSALSFDDPALSGTFVLGAPEVLQPALQTGRASTDQSQTWLEGGLRVLLFAYRPDAAPLRDGANQPRLPDELRPVALLSLSDELRPQAGATIAQFAKQGIALKIISGDNPETVAALAKQAGLEAEGRLVSGLELDSLDETRFAQAAEDGVIFGRVTPQQKERIVRSLRKRGHYVAMTGDGVNDVLALKQAQLAIAMRSGSAMARNVADLVLLDDAFPALPLAFREGQRIRRGMQDILRLFLVRPLSAALIILAASLLGIAFPLTPANNAVVAFLTVGIPAFALAAWARPGPTPRRLLPSAAHFVLPAALTIAGVMLTVYLFYLSLTDVSVARSALTTTAILCGLALIPLVQPPTPAWTGGSVLNGDWRSAILALALLLLYGVLLFAEPLRGFVQLPLLTVPGYVLIAFVVLGWATLLRFLWRLPLRRLR